MEKSILSLSSSTRTYRSKVFYNSENLNLTFGVDRRITTSQGDYIYYNDFNTKVSKEEYRELSNMGLAEEYGERPIIFSDQSLIIITRSMILVVLFKVI